MLWQYNQNHILDTWRGTDHLYNYHNYHKSVSESVPDFELTHSAPLVGGWGGGCGGHLPAKEKITMNFCLCGAILNLKAFCFGAITDTMIELIVYDSGSLSGIETELLGILWLLAQVSGLITELAHGLICPKSGTVLNNDSYGKLLL